MVKGRKSIITSPSLLVLVLGLMGCASAAPPPAPTPPEETSQEAPVLVEERDLVYATVDGKQLLLDLFYQKNAKQKLPLVVFIHGSEHSFYMANKLTFYYSAQQAAKRGYAAASIAYRTTAEKVEGKSKYEFPAQVHDVKCAIRWLKANAAGYGIDAGRLAAVGYSSGGYLALMLGLTDPSCGLEGDYGDMSISSRVQAVVNLAGETDAALEYRVSPNYYQLYLGGSPEKLPERYKSASPISYVSPDDPPVCSLIGGEDARLPQVQMLDASLASAGVPHTLIVVPGASHYLEKIVDLQKDGPVWEFLDRSLRAGR
jgi:acetyl esterase/lipase